MKEARIEIAVQTMTNYADTLRLARWCEANGVASLAVADHYLAGPDPTAPALDQLVVLGGIARETTSLAFCTLVSPLTFRHPAVHLKAAVTLDEMSGGRFTLGVGTGWMEQEHDAFGLELFGMEERFARLEETLGYVRAAISGDGTGFAGNYYRLEAFDPQPQPHNLRIVVGGGGAHRTPDLAGRFADEFNIFPSETPWAERIERARHGHARARRDGALMISTAFPAVTGADESEFRTELAARAKRFDQEPDELLDEYRGIGAPLGPIDQVAEQLQTLADLGIERAYLQVGRDIDKAVRQTELFLEAAGS